MASLCTQSSIKQRGWETSQGEDSSRPEGVQFPEDLLEGVRRLYCGGRPPECDGAEGCDGGL